MEDKAHSGKLECQEKFYTSGNTLSIQARITVLNKLRIVLHQKERQILDALKSDLNKPNLEAFVSEIFFLDQEIKLVCQKLRKWLKPQRVKTPFYFLPARSWIQLAPYGQTLVMAPWNYPVQLALAPIIAAVAAGNTVILKPSEISTEVEQVLIEIIAEAFPEGWVTCVCGGAAVSEALLELNFDFVFFTGSTAIGRKVDQQLAGKLTPRVLELGGKCPCIVDQLKEKALIEVADRILTGKFFNAGQTCFGPDFVAVHESQVSALTRLIKEGLQKRFPNGLSEDFASTPSDEHAKRLRDLRDEHAIVIGTDNGRQVAPTIQPIEPDSKLLKEEIFGAILPIISYQDEAQLLHILEPLEAPLALYIFSSDETFTSKLTSSFPSGSVCINDTMKQSSNLHLPFGGIGSSGLGRYRGKWGVEQFSYQRAFTKRYLILDIFASRPPYNGALKKLKKMIRWK